METTSREEDKPLSYTGQWKKAKNKPNNNYYTPDMAIEYIYPYISNFSRVWEPCCGANHISRFLENRGHTVISTDITMGHEYDIFTYAPPPESYDIIVTNPPFQGKRRIMERLYALGKPFVVLMPTMALDSNPVRILLKNNPDWGIIMPPKTINYIPAEHEKSHDSIKHPKGTRSFFHSSWFCHNIPNVRNMMII
jgi:hypothetical protein